MVEINSKSKEIYLESRFGENNLKISINNTQSSIWISKAVSIFCGLEKGKYIQFLNDENEWRFYCNDDPDGFLIHGAKESNKLFLSSLALAKLILKTSGFHKQKVFHIEKTKIMQGDCPVFYLNPNV